MLAQQKHHELWYGGHERRRVSGDADCGRLGEGRAGQGRAEQGVRGWAGYETAWSSLKGEGVHQKRGASLHYARAIGISTRIIIGGRWPATVVTLSFDRSATAAWIVA
jgi:hypothetical protein